MIYLGIALVLLGFYIIIELRNIKYTMTFGSLGCRFTELHKRLEKISHLNNGARLETQLNTMKAFYHEITTKLDSISNELHELRNKIKGEEG